MAWIEPHGLHGWAPPASLADNIEPLCAALNLSRFLLIREQSNSTDLTQVCMLHCIWQETARQLLSGCLRAATYTIWFMYV